MAFRCVKMAVHNVESRYLSMYSFFQLLTGLLFNSGLIFIMKGSMLVSGVQNRHLQNIQNFSHEPWMPFNSTKLDLLIAHFDDFLLQKFKKNFM